MTTPKIPADATTPGAGDAKVETTPTGESTNGATPASSASTPPIDWESDANPWKGKAQKSEERFKSAQGNIRKQQENEALILRLGESLDAISSHLTSEDADPRTLAAKLAEVKSKEATALMASRDKVIATSWFNKIVAKLGEAGISPDDKRVESAIALWTEGGTHENPTDMAKLYEALEVVNDLVGSEKVASANKKTEAAENKAKEAEARFKIDGGILDSANPRGTQGGGFNKDSYIKALKDGGKLPTAAEIDRMTADAMRGR